MTQGKIEVEPTDKGPQLHFDDGGILIFDLDFTVIKESPKCLDARCKMVNAGGTIREMIDDLREKAEECAAT